MSLHNAVLFLKKRVIKLITWVIISIMYVSCTQANIQTATDKQTVT